MGILNNIGFSSLLQLRGVEIEFVKDTLIVYRRIITILPLLLFMTIFMGKRAIGELPVFDFLVIITLGSVVGADIADPEIEHIHTATAIIGIAFLQKIISKLSLKYRKIGKVLTFEPTIVIMDGIFKVKNMRKIHYSLDNILQILREKEVFDISIVKVGILESNGKISVYKETDQSPLLRKDIGLENIGEKMPYPVIVEGKINDKTLTTLGTNKSWLMAQLNEKGIKKTDDIFFASLTSDLKLHLSPVNQDTPMHLRH